MKSRIDHLNKFGQSIWLDNISRSLIMGPELKELIMWGVSGVTSNPTIFEKAIISSSDYDKKIKELKNKGLDSFKIYDELTVKDIQDTADLFVPVFEKSKGLDGYVSLEVNPLLAHNTSETTNEAKRLYHKVNRKNLMLKIPATESGFESVKALCAEGINVNITLIFSRAQYLGAVKAFLEGAQGFLSKGGDLKSLCSVASVFVSRIDNTIDNLIDEQLKSKADMSLRNMLVELKGRAAIANSALIFNEYQRIFSDVQYLQLENKGLKKQRIVWASTSTKNPAYRDVKYVEELIGKSTVNTLPQSTIEAFMDHGRVDDVLSSGFSDSKRVIDTLKKCDIDIDLVCNKLLKDGLSSFEKSFESLLKTIEEK